MIAPPPIVKGFYHLRTFSIRLAVACPLRRRCAIIDAALDLRASPLHEVDASGRAS
jgi:hypothetical protein